MVNECLSNIDCIEVINERCNVRGALKRLQQKCNPA